MRIYNVTGSTCADDISAQAEPFSMNVCAACKRDAYHYAYESMTQRGFRGIVCARAEDLGAPSRTSGWGPGDTLLI